LSPDWKTEGVLDGENSDEEDDEQCVCGQMRVIWMISRLAKFFRRMIPKRE